MTQRNHEVSRDMKSRPIINKLTQKFLSLYNLHRENSVDKSMLGFKGRSSLKQYVPKNSLSEANLKCGVDVIVRIDILALIRFTLENGEIPPKNWVLGYT